MSSFSILDINVFSDKQLANIFSHSIGYLSFWSFSDLLCESGPELHRWRLCTQGSAHHGSALTFSDLLCEAGPGGSAVGGSAHRALHTRVLCSPSLICPVSLGQGSAGGASMVPNLGGQQDNM